MSDPKNNKTSEYFLKLKDKLKKIEFRYHANKLKDKLSFFQSKAHIFNYYQMLKNLKDKKEQIKSKLFDKKQYINRSIRYQVPNFESIFAKISSKSKDLSSNITSSIKEGRIKDDLINFKDNLQKYEYLKNLKTVSQKAKDKLKEAEIQEKIKNITEKAKETANNYKIKEKLTDYSEKSKDTAKIFTEKSKEQFGKTSSFFKDNYQSLGNKFRNFRKEKSKSMFFCVLAIVFIYGFGTNLPRAYYDYRRYTDEREDRRKNTK